MRPAEGRPVMDEDLYRPTPQVSEAIAVYCAANRLKRAEFEIFLQAAYSRGRVDALRASNERLTALASSFKVMAAGLPEPFAAQFEEQPKL